MSYTTHIGLRYWGVGGGGGWLVRKKAQCFMRRRRRHVSHTLNIVTVLKYFKFFTNTSIPRAHAYVVYDDTVYMVGGNM